LGARYTVDSACSPGECIFPTQFHRSADFGLRRCTDCLPDDILYAGCGTPLADGTYRAALDHEFTNDVMGYISWNRGVKSGQFDTFGTAAGGPANNPPVNPEILKSVEAGLKSEWFDHHLQVNLSAFHYDVSNLQFAVIVAGGTKLINAAGAKSMAANSPSGRSP